MATKVVLQAKVVLKNTTTNTKPQMTIFLNVHRVCFVSISLLNSISRWTTVRSPQAYILPRFWHPYPPPSIP